MSDASAAAASSSSPSACVSASGLVFVPVFDAGDCFEMSLHGAVIHLDAASNEVYFAHHRRFIARTANPSKQLCAHAAGLLLPFISDLANKTLLTEVTSEFFLNEQVAVFNQFANNIIQAAATLIEQAPRLHDQPAIDSACSKYASGVMLPANRRTVLSIHLQDSVEMLLPKLQSVPASSLPATSVSLSPSLRLCEDGDLLSQQRMARHLLAVPAASISSSSAPRPSTSLEEESLHSTCYHEWETTGVDDTRVVYVDLGDCCPINPAAPHNETTHNVDAEDEPDSDYVDEGDGSEEEQHDTND